MNSQASHWNLPRRRGRTCGEDPAVSDVPQHLSPSLSGAWQLLPIVMPPTCARSLVRGGPPSGRLLSPALAGIDDLPLLVPYFVVDHYTFAWCTAFRQREKASRALGKLTPPLPLVCSPCRVRAAAGRPLALFQPRAFCQRPAINLPLTAFPCCAPSARLARQARCRLGARRPPEEGARHGVSAEHGRGSERRPPRWR